MNYLYSTVNDRLIKEGEVGDPVRWMVTFAWAKTDRREEKRICLSKGYRAAKLAPTGGKLPPDL